MSSPNVNVRNIPGLNIPEHDYVALTYHGTTNNVATATYKRGGSGGTTQAVLTLSYVGGTPSADDARLEGVART
jgi:hypothetical protein